MTDSFPDPAVNSIIAHLARVAAGAVSPEACAAAKTFIADTLGVGNAGVWRPGAMKCSTRPRAAPRK